jgi:phosphonate transport system substrate-binding protein
MRQSWRFALPPSVSDGIARSALVRTSLSTIGCGSVRSLLTYNHLIHALQSGEVDAAWAPPLVCARLEAAGSRILLRAVRAGTGSYRAAIFARADRKLSLERLPGTTVGWLDPQSMSGYVLPRALLHRARMDPDTTFARVTFLGSHAACVKAVLDGKVDVASTYASPAHAEPVRHGFVELAGARGSELAPVAFSDECPNDGILLSTSITAEESQEFALAFEHLRCDRGPARALARALDVDDFDVPAPGSYQVLSSRFVETWATQKSS